MSTRINAPDFSFGTFLIGLGAFAYGAAGELPAGTAASMGPGYVPRGLALLIMIYGAVMALRALFAGRQALPGMAWRPLVLIFSAVALFAVVLPLAGLALTGFAVVVCAGLAAYDMRVRENLVFAAALAAFAVLLFVIALGLPIRIWPW
jgi:hypothetical protein